MKGCTPIRQDIKKTIIIKGNKDKNYKGAVDSLASRIDTNKRSLAVRIKLKNPNLEILPGALLEVTIKYNERNSLGIPYDSHWIPFDFDNIFYLIPKLS